MAHICSIMAWDEQAYIALCRAQIEKKFAFGNGHGYTQRDLESLSQEIEEKAGLNISLSTLKRLWKGSFKQSPQIATLNALAVLLDYQDWQDFKLQNQPAEKRSKTKSLRLAGLIILILITATLFALNFMKREIKVNGPVHFSAQKTVTSGIPNTVIFHYDVSQVEADSFYIQQSWNQFHRMPIDPKGKAFSSIYYESGYHRARLYANDSMLAMQPIHIMSEGWEPHIYYSYEDEQPINLKHENIIEQGQLHLSEALLQKRKIDYSRHFFTRISNSQAFNVSSDNFSIHSRIKVDSLMDKLCSWMQMTVVTERHIFWVNLQNKGCEHNASYKAGEIIRRGENNDLSALGSDLYQWQDIRLHVIDKHAKISINGEVAFEETFEEDFGKIMGLIYIFDGTGSLDYVHLADAQDNTVFVDDFNLESAILP